MDWIFKTGVLFGILSVTGALVLIWRAILGKSSVDVKMIDRIDKNTKALESVANKLKDTINSNEKVSSGVSILTKTMSGLPEDIATKHKQALEEIIKNRYNA